MSVTRSIIEGRGVEHPCVYSHSVVITAAVNVGLLLELKSILTLEDGACTKIVMNFS